MLDEARLIDLYGVTTGIVGRDKNRISYFFFDEICGEIIIDAKSDCPLLYTNTKGKMYHLKVELRGVKGISKNNKKPFTKNLLIIKEVEELKR